MSIDEQIDITVDQFKWEVYTEMLEMADEETPLEGYQSRFVETEAKKLLGGFYGVDSTEYYPFLQHYIDFWDDEYSSAGTLIHELSHNVLEQIENETEVSDHGSTEERAQKLEADYLLESTYLEEKGLKQQLIVEARKTNEFL